MTATTEPKAIEAADSRMFIGGEWVASVTGRTFRPFGGVKEAGNGHREASHAALDTYTEWESIYVDFSGKLQRAQIDNQPDDASR